MSHSTQDFIQRNFLEHFLGLHGPRIIRQSKKAAERKAAERKATAQGAAPPARAPVALLQPAPIPAPVSAPVPSPALALAPPATEKTHKPTPDSAAAESGAAEVNAAEAELTWTDMEDAILIGLKALNKTWKEIGAAIEGKHTEDLRARYDALTTPAKEEAKPAEKAAENSEAKTQDKVEDISEGNTEKVKEVEVQVGEGGATQKEGSSKKAGKENKKNKKGKAVSDEAQEKKAKAMEDQGQGQESKAEGAKDKGGKGKTGKKSKEIKGILKKGGATPPFQSDEEPSSHEGRPIIYVDNGDGLDINELMVLYRLHQELDRKKWVQLSSKFFDKTGKRASPELLKEKLRNC